MRLLYLSSNPNIGINDSSGPGTHIREMISAFRELGHEVLPLISGNHEMNKFSSPPEKNNLKRSIKEFLPQIFWETAKDIVSIKNGWHLERELLQQSEQFKPDLIYERAASLQLAGCNVASRKNIRHIIEINAPFREERMAMQGKSLLNFMIDKAERKQVEFPERVVVVSSALKKYLSEKYPGNDKKIIITPNAIRLQKLPVDENEKIKIKEKYDLKNGLIIGFVGSIFPYHGVDLLIRSFRELLEKHNNCKLLIVGDGETLPSLKKLAGSLNLGNSIVFTGNITNEKVGYYIDLMDICVMPRSNWYGSPVKIFEYGMHGKPIVAPDNAPLRDIMENNKHGLLISSGAPGLTPALMKLVESESLRKFLGENFRKKVIEEHTWEKMAEKILNLAISD